MLNDSPLVKCTTRARVLKAIEELKYSPNLYARNLAGGKSWSIGVIVPNIENPFFLDVYRAVEAGAHRAGVDVVMASTDYSSERLLASIRSMIERRLAGVAAIVPEMDSNSTKELHDSRVPVVLYDVGDPGAKTTSIRVTYRCGMEKLVTYLHSLGHRRLGFAGHHSTSKPISERLKVLLEAVTRYSGLKVTIARDADSLDGGRYSTRALLKDDPKLTAIVCINDLMAIGALRELRERRIRVPGDVSVTGFDNIKWSEFCQPALTPVHIPRDQIRADHLQLSDRG